MIPDGTGAYYEDNTYVKLVDTTDDLTHFVGKASCQTIAANSFASCQNVLQTISFEEGSQLQQIASSVFSGHSKLISADFSNCASLKTLPSYLFSDSSLRNIILPPNLYEIQQRVFLSCTKLENFSLPDSVERLNAYWFLYRCSCRHIYISNNSKLSYIASESFVFCNLDSIFIPEKIANLNRAFELSDIKSFIIHPKNTNFKAENCSIFSSDMKNLIYSSASGVFHLPESVDTLSEGCLRGSDITQVIFPTKTMKSFGSWFLGQSKIVNFSFPKGITAVPSSAFYDTPIESVTLTEDIIRIDSQAFALCDNLKTIDLQYITSIGNQAFISCSHLEIIELPASLTHLGTSVFADCPKLNITSRNPSFQIVDFMLFTSKTVLSEYFGSTETLTIPAHCTQITSYVFQSKEVTKINFQENSNLTELSGMAFQQALITEITLPPSLKTIGNNCFYNCKNLEKVEFSGYLITSLPKEAFAHCTSLKTIILPSSLCTIGDSAFYKCIALNNFPIEQLTSLETISTTAFSEANTISSVKFPVSFTEIGISAFESCQNLQIVDFSYASNLKNITASAFSNCPSLNKIIFSNKTENIEQEAFSGCVSLETILLPQDIRNIYQRAFFGCDQLSKVEFPLNCNLEHIYGRAFAECDNLQNFTINENDQNFTFDEGVLMNEAMTYILVFLPSSSINMYVVPANVQTIGEYAFQGCTNLYTIIIPDGNINRIGYSAFEGCSKLTFIYLPKSLTTIDQKAFDGCTNLRCGSITYSSNIKDKLIDAGVPKEILQDHCKFRKLETCHHSKYSLSFITFGSVYLFLSQ